MPPVPQSCEAIAPLAKMAEDVVDYIVDCRPILKAAETFASVDSFSVDVAGLTISGTAANGTDFIDDTQSPTVDVPAGKGLLLTIAGGIAGQKYKIRLIGLLTGGLGKKKGALLTLLVQ